MSDKLKPDLGSGWCPSCLEPIKPAEDDCGLLCKACKDKRPPALALKLYRGVNGYLFGQCAGKLWRWMHISGIWHEETFYGETDLLEEFTGELIERPGCSPYTRAALVARMERQLADSAESRARTREKLAELIEKPAIWAQLNEISESVHILYVSKLRSNPKQNEHFTQVLAGDLEGLLHQLRAEGFNW